jgi:hypothetical protein
MAAANLALAQRRDQAAGKAPVADGAGAHVPVLLQTPKLERQSSFAREWRLLRRCALSAKTRIP